MKIKELMEDTTKKMPHLYLDMDGVQADFFGAWAAKHNVGNYKEIPATGKYNLNLINNYVQPNFEFIIRQAEPYASEVGYGQSLQSYSGSIKLELGRQDYDIYEELKDGDIKHIFKSIEDQESDLKEKDVFNLFKKIKIDTEPIGYAGFINGNSYNEIKKYLDKYPIFFINYITQLDYNLILDKNKENQIRKALQSYLLELEGPDYIEGFKALLDLNSDLNPAIPSNFIRWILL